MADLIALDGDTLTLSVGMPIKTLLPQLRREMEALLFNPQEAAPLRLLIEQQIPRAATHNSAQQVPGVKNIIAVASGKGGVGKSTVAANLALALAYEGARVGVLDADIYGPSQPQMLGTGEARPEVVENRAIKPLLGHGIQMISMGSLVTDNTPMVWRGPMVSGALKQLLNQTLWDEVDYLVVDMPPGTGDIQLTLSQSVPVSTSVIVTTPQDIALLDARKGIEMFRKVSIPVTGIVENMALHVCPQCGHEEAIFGEHGGEQLAQDYATQLLGRLPLQRAIREQMDRGEPPLVADPESSVSQCYREIALKVAADLWQNARQPSALNIQVVDD